MYCSSGGSTDWTNACDTSPLFGIRFMLTAMEVSKRTSVCDKTGAKQSVLDQLFGSRFPRTTIRYLQRLGSPFLSLFNVEIAIVGSAGPVTFLSVLYSFSVIISKAGKFLRPSYSSS